MLAVRHRLGARDALTCCRRAAKLARFKMGSSKSRWRTLADESRRTLLAAVVSVAAVSVAVAADSSPVSRAAGMSLSSTQRSTHTVKSST